MAYNIRNQAQAGAKNRLLRAENIQKPAVNRLVIQENPQEDQGKTVGFSKTSVTAARHEPHHGHNKQSLAYAQKMEEKFASANKASAVSSLLPKVTPQDQGNQRKKVSFSKETILADQIKELVLEYRRAFTELRAEKQQVRRFSRKHSENPVLASDARKYLEEIQTLEKEVLERKDQETSPQFPLSDKPYRVHGKYIRHETLADDALRSYRRDYDSSKLQPAFDHYQAELSRLSALKGAPEKLQEAEKKDALEKEAARKQALFNSLLEIAKADTSLSAHGRQVERRHSDPGPQREVEHKAPRRFSLGSSKPKGGTVSPEASSPAKPGFSFAEKFKKIQPMSFVERIKSEVSGRVASPAA